MCFIVSVKHPDRILAETEIKCYKVLIRRKKTFLGWVKSTYYSRFEGFKYKMGKLYACDHLYFAISQSRSFKKIEQGFHSYTSKEKALNIAQQDWSRDGIDLVVVKFIIPIGAEYFYSPECKEYVSTQIIPIGEI